MFCFLEISQFAWKICSRLQIFAANTDRLVTTLRAFTYDAAGNITRDTRGATQYNYTISSAGRIARVAVGTSVRADYVYDGKSRLASRVTQNQAGAGTTRLFHDNDNRVIAEVNAAGTTVREYIWLDDLPVAVLDGTTSTTNPTLFFVHADHLNRPVAMSNAAKAWVWRAQYEPFGAVHQIVGPAANDSRFPGQWFQLEAGLAYNWHRHYDATLGRYTQPDPLGVVQAPPSKTQWVARAEPVRPSPTEGGVDDQTRSPGVVLRIVDDRMGFDPSIAGGKPHQDGPALYNYARQRPLQLKDPTGLITDGGGFTPRPKGGAQTCELTVQTCQAALMACQKSGRDRSACLKAYFKCSRYGMPTIFGPGIVGQPQ